MHPGLNLTVLIGSVRDLKRLNSIFEKYCPEIVFHAAAHKHVPLMEASPDEAVKNNVMGTYYTACAALAFHCRRFILVSTDKACEPQSAMGASKRICEMIISALNLMRVTQRDDSEVSPLPFDIYFLVGEIPAVCVRILLPYVLEMLSGSNGSIVPLFLKTDCCGWPCYRNTSGSYTVFYDDIGSRQSYSSSKRFRKKRRDLCLGHGDTAED